MTHVGDALWNSGHDESVEVNQRALIDKVLARYSGEFTVFRELLQNSDDAQSTAVEIRFETEKYRDGENGNGEPTGGKEAVPDLKTVPVHYWMFKNNGTIFRDQDWSRLKKIAEGNPDEEKIGAFGVGFYSLFSVTEEPFVTSGDQWMGFYWKDKKDQLIARRGNLPDGSHPNPWTSFSMNLREPAPIPGAFDLTRFVASSITFMSHLSEVSIYFDDKLLAKLTKSPGIPSDLTIPAGLKKSSEQGIMDVSGIKSTSLHIEAEVMRCVYDSGTTKKPKPLTTPAEQTKSTGSSLGGLSNNSGATTPQRVPTPLPAEPVVVDPFSVTETQVTLSIFSADVNVLLGEKMKAELNRSTKKNPPSKLKYELIYTAKDQYDASIKEDEKLPFATGSVFQGVRADLNGTGSARVFIGHSTGQTTGIGGHMAARFIPTVERESIDLVDRNVSVWNRELLYVGGFLSRAAYELELATIAELWDSAKSAGGQPDEELQARLRGRALHALKFFTFHTSTPSSGVSTELEKAFFSCSEKQLSIISTAGVRNAKDVRFPNQAFAAFVKQLPVLPDDLSTKAPQMINALQGKGMLTDIQWMDVLDELRERPLPSEEMAACLKWWVECNSPGQLWTELLNAAILVTGTMGTSTAGTLPLRSVQTFLNKSQMGFIPVEEGAPLPSHLLPLSVSKHFDPTSILTSFRWRELSIVDWLQHTLSPAVTTNDVGHDITKSPQWSERVFSVLGQAWPSIPQPTQSDICALLKEQACIPTNTGLKLPDQSYFSMAHVFKDLPIITLPSGTVVKGDLEKVFIAVGVRKRVELQIVFDRMVKTGDWAAADLIKYLVNVKSTLSAGELEKLQVTDAFSKEGDVGENKTRYRAVDLYEPQDLFRQLGLPIINWGSNTKWKSSSAEAKFLHSKLGLRRYASLEDLIALCASPDANVRQLALKYFLDKHSTRYMTFDPAKFPDVAFIPAGDKKTPRLALHKEVFSQREWAPFGFLVANSDVLNADALTKLKIKAHPDSSALVSLLEKTPPKDEAAARHWFSTLAGHIADFSTSELQQLSTLPFVPVEHVPRTREGSQTAGARYLPPNRCYFAGAAREQFHSKLFSFINFGPSANAFLSACGTKNEPSVEEVARVLLDNPPHFLQLADGLENFLIELRNIAVNWRQISSFTLSRMKEATILPAFQRRTYQVPESTIDGLSVPDLDENTRPDMVCGLCRPDQIVIADDTNGYQLFGDQIFTAPQEDLLEHFYMELGSRRLSTLVKEEYKTSSEVKGSKVASDIRELILQRLPLFLHEHTHSPRDSYDWLKDEKNFIVRTFGKLTVTKSLSFGDARLSSAQEASAVATRVSHGAIELWLAEHTLVDMYEVSSSLCRLLFETPKVNDTLLFMTILSTDIEALKRRGYNVDRILKRAREGEEAAKVALISETTDVQKGTRAWMTGILNSMAYWSRSPMPTTVGSNDPPGSTGASATWMTGIPRILWMLNSITYWSDSPIPTAVGSNDPPGSTEASASWMAGVPGVLWMLNSITYWSRSPIPTTVGSNDPPGSTGASASGPRPNNSVVTPQSNISLNIDQAIEACTQEQGHLMRNRDHMQMVKESLDEGYCDISGRVGDLNFIGQMENIKVYASRDIPQFESLMIDKHDALTRFIHIIQPLAQVYKLAPTSIHIFYGLGSDIAFNRNASLFLNLRDYEDKHDADVQKGDVSTAYISWFFTLAHEIAHNLVQQHDSEHEFYFSAICERYIIQLAKLLAPT